MTKEKILNYLSNPIFNKKEISRRMGISQPCFWNKVNGKNRQRLNENDFKKLGEIFKSL